MSNSLDLGSWDMLAAGEMNGTSLCALRARLGAARKQVRRGKRCTQCKAAKTKCDGNIPCSRCISKGRSEKCEPVFKATTPDAASSQTGEGGGVTPSVIVPDSGQGWESQGGLHFVDEGVSTSMSSSYHSRQDSQGRSSISAMGSASHSSMESSEQAMVTSHPRHPDYQDSSSPGEEIERPMIPNRVVYTNEARVDPEYENSLPHRFFRFWNIGVSWKDHRDFFTYLTPSCKRSVEMILEAVLTIVEHKRNDPSRKRICNSEEEQMAWDDSKSVSFASVYFDPLSASRLGVYMNSRKASDFECDIDDALSRSSSNQLPLPQTQWRYFREMIAMMCSFLQPSFTRFARWHTNCLSGTPGSNRVQFVRLTLRKVFNADGLLSKVLSSAVTVEPAEYDAVVAQDPEKCDPFCTSPGWCNEVMTAKAHLTARNLGELETMEAVAATQGGRQCMDAMGAEILKRGKLVLELADRIRVARHSGTEVPSHAEATGAEVGVQDSTLRVDPQGHGSVVKIEWG